MFIVTKQMMRAAVLETPEGRAYYPDGRAGYLIDSPTEARVARFLTIFFFAQIAFVTVFASLGSATNNRAISMVLCVAMLVAVRVIGLRLVLRGVPRATTPMRREDAVRRAAATYGATRMYLMAAAFLILVPTPLFVFRNDPPWQRATMLAFFLAMAAYACVFCIRVLRAKAAMGSSEEGDRA